MQCSPHRHTVPAPEICFSKLLMCSFSDLFRSVSNFDSKSIEINHKMMTLTVAFMLLFTYDLVLLVPQQNTSSGYVKSLMAKWLEQESQ